MAKKVGQGIFTRQDSSCCYSAVKDGYIYWINEVKNYDPKRGWKILKRDGDNEYVFILMKRKKGFKRYSGEKAYSLYESLIKHYRFVEKRQIVNLGYHTYAVKKKKSKAVKVYDFMLIENDRFQHEKEKTKLAVYYEEKYVSGYFSSFRECLNYSEDKLLST